MTPSIIKAIVGSTIEFALSNDCVDFTLSVDEFMIFLAICFTIGLIGFRRDRRFLWGSSPMDNNAFIHDLMPRKRFEAINRYLHLPEGAKEVLGKPDPFHKVSWL